MSNPRSTAQIGGHPIHAMIVPFPIALYFATFAADLVFAATVEPFWAIAAFWLLTAGVAMSALAALIGFVDFFGAAEVRRLKAAWWHMGGNVLVALISISDLILRYLAGPGRGSHNFVWLALAVVLLLVFTGWKGGEMVYRHRVGVAD